MSKIYNVSFPEAYLDKDGNTKTKWHNVGTLIEGQKQDGSPFRMLKLNAIPGFALPALKHDGTPIVYSLFEQQQQNNNNGGQAQNGAAKPAAANNNYDPSLGF
jgi:hypothetical protein